jgi:hypothetical protein
VRSSKLIYRVPLALGIGFRRYPVADFLFFSTHFQIHSASALVMFLTKWLTGFSDWLHLDEWLSALAHVR